MKRLSRENLVYAFSSYDSPALAISPGDRICVETEDCFSGVIQHESQTVGPYLPIPGFNPATGPIAIRGAYPGETLRLSIETIRLSGQGVTTVTPGFGLLGASVSRAVTCLTTIDQDQVVFRGRFRLPLRKMIGVIGVAPAADSIPCDTPGCHGGNLDTVEIGERCKVYLPIFVRNALFALGDVHAVMADGEICGTGVETRAEVVLSADIVSDMGIDGPIVETDTAWIVIQSDTTVEAAALRAATSAAAFLQRRLSMSFEDAYMLLSLVGDHRISQLVNPLVTVRVRIPKAVLAT